MDDPTSGSMALFGDTGHQFIPSWKLSRQQVPIKVDVSFGGGGCVTDRQYARQYCHTYGARLKTIRPGLEVTVKTEWCAVELKKVRELCEFSQASNLRVKTIGGKDTTDHAQNISIQEGVTVAIIGTLFKTQARKPSVLQDLCDKREMVPTVAISNYTSPTDSISLEDESGMVQLISTRGYRLDIGHLTNGIVCAVRGRPTINGKFGVSGILFPSAVPQPPLTHKMSIDMVFVSGLEIGGRATYNSALKLDMLWDYLGGLGASNEELNSEIAKKAIVFLVGNTFGSGDESVMGDQANKAQLANRVDEKLEQLAKIIDVCMLVGEQDPSLPMLPQPAVRKFVLPRTSCYPSFSSMPNPVRLEIPACGANQYGGPMVDMIFTSGQNVDDTLRNVCKSATPIEIAKSLLRWAQLAPTAPDTLPLRPDLRGDEFILKKLPHFFIVGNQNEFGVGEWNQTKICMVPKFCETGSVVILTADMELVELHFKAMP